MLQFCFQPQCQAPSLWVLSCQVTQSVSCLTSVPAPLPPPAPPPPPPPWACLPCSWKTSALKKPDSIDDHTAFFSAAPVLCPACISSNALRSAPSQHCYKLFFFFFWYPALSTAPGLIASCYKLFLKLPSIMLFTHAFRRTLCHVEC